MDDESDDESIEDIPLKKRQKTSVEATGSKSLAKTEDKALKLLSSQAFF